MLLNQMSQPPSIHYHDGSEAHYDPVEDEIILPNHGDEQQAAYLLFVQLIHWTGHKTRLKRNAISEGALDGSYDLEEQFIADIGASMLARLFKIPLDWNVGIAEEEVINFWIQALEEDNRFIFRVASQAQAAVAYILGH